MIEKTLICFLVFTQPDIDTGEPVVSSNVELVCVEADDETITDILETNEQKTEGIEETRTN